MGVGVTVFGILTAVATAALAVFSARLYARLRSRESLLAEREAWIRALLTTIDGPVYVSCPERKITYYHNPGGSEGEGIGEPCHKVLYGLDAPCPWCEAEKVEEGEAVRDEVQSPRDGKWYRSIHAPIRDAAGRVSVLGLLFDVTGYKTTLAAAEKRKAEYRKLLEGSNDAVLIADIETGTILEANRKAEELFGYPLGEIIGMHHARLHPEGETSRYYELFARHARGDARLTEEIPMRRKDGREVPVEISSSLLEWKGRRAMQGIFHDVTDRRRVREVLKESRNKVRFFVENAPAAVAMLDGDMRYLIVSKRWRTDYGLGDREIIGRSHYEVFPEIPERWKEIHRRCLAGADEKCDEDPFPRLDGTTDWVRWEIHPWRDDVGAVGGIIMFTEVITPRKRAEEEARRTTEELRRANEKLIETERQKSEFLAALSHELRTPLAISLGSVENLRAGIGGPVTPGQERLLEIVEQSSKRLARLIENLLDLSRYDADRFEIRARRIDLREPVRTAAEGIRPLADKKRLSTEIFLPSEPIEASADADKIVQVVGNLLDNALRFARSRIEVSLARRDGAATITVRNDGEGISEEEIPLLFDKFYRSPSASKGRIGLGLFIVRAIVEAHGGEILVANLPSEEGGGVRFTARLPFVS